MCFFCLVLGSARPIDQRTIISGFSSRKALSQQEEKGEANFALPLIMGSGSSSLPAGTATSAPSAYAPGDYPSEERAPQLSAASHSRLPNSTGREIILVAPAPSNDTAAEVIERRGVER
eukprot:RCo054840